MMGYPPTMAFPERFIDEIDRRIARLMPEAGRPDPLYGMMKYHLGWVDQSLRPAKANAGKRIRARLCLLTCIAAGASPERALAPATAVELVHNFSLIHDDIQDRSQYRRHRRTVWDIWGEAQAINGGDGMLVLAQLALAEDEESDPRLVVRALRSLNQASRLLCEGQFLDLDYESRSTVGLEDYFAMIERKTAALLEASCFLGALYGLAGESALQAYSRFGEYLGLAFQIQDDYLGIWGDPKATGKPSAADVASKKKTLPLLYALSEAGSADRDRMQAVLGQPGSATDAETEEILGILDRCGAAGYTASEVARTSQIALEALASAEPDPSAGEELASLCRELTIRAS
ncbi:MAG: polyprenyl synthetase family protein [Bacteroidetes bacterium]|nr:polyprenyl synthetase family protein [Bacteroidota bacterium]